MKLFKKYMIGRNCYEFYALGKPVYAPNMTIHSYPNGTHWIEDNGRRGEFVKFVPEGIKHGRK